VQLEDDHHFQDLIYRGMVRAAVIIVAFGIVFLGDEVTAEKKIENYRLT
jgi:hypothetical protein